MEKLRCLDRQILEQNGAYVRVKSYYEGSHPEIPGAVLTNGWTGPETIVEKTGIRPSRTFRVEDKK